MNTSQQPTRHVVSISGGKDSAALAVFLRDRLPDAEYVFMDTGEELPETYEYLDRLEAFLGKGIKRLNPDRPFSHFLDLYRGVLPDARTRWCTRMLKIKPFEREFKDAKVMSYLAIRADESHRKGYISSRPNITPVYPFIEAGIRWEDVHRLLEDAGIGLPTYYRWRSRSGCFFCFFQQRIEWVGLLENHPDLFERASRYEKYDPVTGDSFTWSGRESLEELRRPERIAQIKAESAKRGGPRKARPASPFLIDIFDEERGCDVCHL